MEQQITIDLDVFPIIKDSIDISQVKNIILIDKTIENKEIFFSSNNNETLPIYYNYYTDRDKLFEYLEKEFINIDRIAFIFDNSMMNNKYFLNNELFFTENDIIKFENNKECLVDNYSSNLSFLIKICKKFNVKNVDFLACNSLEYTNWQNYYEILTYYLGPIIGASTDLTGNIKYGGNWIMENTKEDIQNIYFNENITNYSSTLFSSSIANHRYNFIGDNFFSVNVKNNNINSIITLTNFTDLFFFAIDGLTPINPTENYVLYYRNINNNTFISINDIENMNIIILPNDEYEILVAFQTPFYIVFGEPVAQNTLLVSDDYLSLYAGKSGYNPDINAYNTLSPNAIYTNLVGTAQLSYRLNYTYQSTPPLTNPVIINNSNELLYVMNTSSTYANIANSLEINYDLIASSYKVLTGNNIKITKSTN